MSQEVLLKIYGHIWPAGPDLHEALLTACADALPAEELSVTLDGDLCCLSFEGVYFPLQECLAVLQEGIRPEHQGKLDVLDLEAWQLTRHQFVAGRIETSSAPLNNVLAYSGH